MSSFRWLPCFLLLLVCGAPAQNSAISAAGTTQGVFGQTINAVTGQPIARALVRCGNQAMLTNYEGRFRFSSEDATAAITANKPGYTMSEDPRESVASTQRSSLRDGSVEIRMYPEAVLTGTVLAPDGHPIPNVMVEPRRSVYDEAGHHWSQTAVTRTDSHGSFRLPLAAGDYILQTRYVPPTAFARGAVLPVRFPVETSSSGSGLLHLRSGETEHVDLHPQVRPVTEVKARLEPENAQHTARLTAYAEEGRTIPLRLKPGEQQGEVKFEIPYGTYTLSGRSQTSSSVGRLDPVRRHGLDGSEQAETRIKVGQHDDGGVVLRFAPLSPIPVELVVEPSSTSDNSYSLTIARLGLSLENMRPDLADTGDSMERLITWNDQTSVFNPPAGRYRLRAQSDGSWFVRSASYGTSDLLRQELMVAPGAGTLPIRIVASNQTGSLSGTVRSNGQSVAAWVYLVASMPSATPVLIVHTDADGLYTRSAMPPGAYRAIAFEHMHGVNYEDQDVLASLNNAMQSVTLNAGDKATLNLDLTSLPAAR